VEYKKNVRFAMKFKRIKDGEFTKAKCYICKVGKVEFTHQSIGYCKTCKENIQTMVNKSFDDNFDERYNPVRDF
jgi:ribosomal protein L37AE/L43A